jgi:uncharacterized protein (TIGR00290 family)
MMKVFASWSSGKDGCLACYEAISQGHEVAYLLNMIMDDTELTMGHGIDSGLVRAQAQAMGIPLVQQRCRWDEYESKFKSAVTEMMRDGVQAGVFGDIGYIDDHQDWIRRVCGDLGIEPLLPLWGRDPGQTVRDFVQSGFEAVVVVCKPDAMNDEWLGRTVDRSFLDDLTRLHNVDAAGEAGEYHTLVVDGPLFNQRIEITAADKILNNDRWFLDILDYRIVE